MEVLAIEQSIQWWLQKPTNKFLYASINLPDWDKIWTFSKPNIWHVQTEQMRRQAIYFPDSPTKQISVLVFQLSRSARSSCTSMIGLPPVYPSNRLCSVIHIVPLTPVTPVTSLKTVTKVPPVNLLHPITTFYTPVTRYHSNVTPPLHPLTPLSSSRFGGI